MVGVQHNSCIIASGLSNGSGIHNLEDGKTLPLVQPYINLFSSFFFCAALCVKLSMPNAQFSQHMQGFIMYGALQVKLFKNY